MGNGNVSKYIFLLIGKTGSGKSATGNSILGEKYFVLSDKGISITKEIAVKTVVRHGLSITAIDTPGVMETSVKSDGAKSKSCTKMTTAMSQCPRAGKLAIVLVLKYGERFTEENRMTMYILKNIFGDQNLWKSFIIVMTHGDLFKINNEDDVTFESWLRDQGGELGELFKDCSYRCVLFNNRTKRPEEIDEQFLELVKLTKALDQDYTMAKFEEAKNRQNRLMLEEKLPEVIKEYNKKIKSLYFSASLLSSKDERYNTFINNINEITEELNGLDRPDKIYYMKDEPFLLQEQKQDLCSLKEEVETKVTLKDLETKGLNLKAEALPYEYSWRLLVKKLEQPIYFIATKINSNPQLYKYQDRLWSLQSTLKELQLIIKRHDEIRSYKRTIYGLESELNSISIPSPLDKFSQYFVKANEFRSEVMRLNEEIGGLKELFPKIDALERLIQYKLEDSAATSGWNKTSVMTGILSAGTVFIPGVGIPLSIGLNVVPFIGRTIHRRIIKLKNIIDQNN